jgi:hypothetical protein
VFGGDASTDSLRMVNHEGSKMDLRRGIILVQVFALVQCSADRSIALRRATACVLVSRTRRGAFPFISQG